jgi:hypothetical protein
LFCTIAQTGQVFDVLPRSGNVQDSNGALEFIPECIRIIRNAWSGLIIEVRTDSAFSVIGSSGLSKRKRLSSRYLYRLSVSLSLNR